MFSFQPKNANINICQFLCDFSLRFWHYSNQIGRQALHELLVYPKSVIRFYDDFLDYAEPWAPNHKPVYFHYML